MNWSLISNISAIVTCIAFVLYVIGHIWSIHISKNKIFEKFEFINEDIDDVEYIDFGKKEYGRIFSVSSPEGIKSIKIFKAQHQGEDFVTNKGKLLKEVKNIKPNQKVYIRANFTDVSSNIYLEIQRADYIKTSFLVADSGKDGSFQQVNYTNKMTFMSWLYYLCK